MKKMKKRPVVLIILDGWGMNHHTDQVDAVRMAHPVNFERYRKEYPFTELRADGEFVGLPEGQFGNSEVGHLNIGAGRVVYQLLPVSVDIRSGINIQETQEQIQYLRDEDHQVEVLFVEAEESEIGRAHV